MAKRNPTLSPDTLFEDAAYATLHGGLRKMMDNAAGTRAGLRRSTPTPADIEALHDMRVGSRRLRAGLSVFAPVFPPREFRALNREVGRITDALGAVRDLDVQGDYLRGLIATLPANEAYGIERLLRLQTRRRDRERKALLATLDAMERDHFERRFRKALRRALPQSVALKLEAA